MPINPASAFRHTARGRRGRAPAPPSRDRRDRRRGAPETSISPGRLMDMSNYMTPLVGRSIDRDPGRHRQRRQGLHDPSRRHAVGPSPRGPSSLSALLARPGWKHDNVASKGSRPHPPSMIMRTTSSQQSLPAPATPARSTAPARPRSPRWTTSRWTYPRVISPPSWALRVPASRR